MAVGISLTEARDMTDTDLLVQTVANGERLGGDYNYQKRRWNRHPRALISFMKDE
jgi:hypothetical protein